MTTESIDWTPFLCRAAEPFDTHLIRRSVEGKRILITGAGGFIGSAIARALAQLKIEHLCLLDVAEAGLHNLALHLDAAHPGLSRDLVVGDICDAALLQELFETQHVQLVFHAAACKHVSLMERNPFAAARTNVLGTQRVLESAIASRVERMVALSTDKAVAPRSIMGATKRIAELLVIASESPTRVNAVRLGNVLGSTGSVVPLLQEQIAQGGPMTLTDAACTRYFVSIDEAIRAVLSALLVDYPSSVLVSQPGKPSTLVELAEFLLKGSDLDRQEIAVRFTGLRPGEKLVEQMLSGSEATVPAQVKDLVIISSQPSSPRLADRIDRVKNAIECRDLAVLLHGISALVPDYMPSDYLLKQAKLRAIDIMTA